MRDRLSGDVMSMKSAAAHAIRLTVKASASRGKQRTVTSSNKGLKRAATSTGLNQRSFQSGSHGSSVYSSLLTLLHSSSIRVFIGIILHPHRICRTTSLLVGGTGRSGASLVMERWIATLRERVLDTHSSHVPEENTTDTKSHPLIHQA